MKKFLSFTLSLMMVMALVACGNKATSSSSTSTSSKKLIMCTNAEFPPYEFKDGGEFKGIDIEVAKLIGEKLGW